MRSALLLIASSLLAGSSLAAPTAPVSDALAEARAELDDAEAEVARLRAEAEAARDDAAQLASEREAAAAEIAAAESRINAAEIELEVRMEELRSARARLAEKRRPAAALVAGLVNMGRTPPLAAAADSGSLQELVRIRSLLDTTLPIVRERSRDLAAELELHRDAVADAEASRESLADARQQLELRQADYLELEQQVLARAEQLDVEAVGAGDRMIVMSEEARRLARAERRSTSNRELARELAQFPPAPRRSRSAAEPVTPFAFRLPANAPIASGLGSIDRAGIRARGTTFETTSGDEIIAPASGTVRFSGPFRRHDGVVIIDHGNGWMTLLTGVSSALERGNRVRAGERIGTALGRITVELSRNGRHISPAVAAARSLAINAG